MLSSIFAFDWGPFLELSFLSVWKEMTISLSSFVYFLPFLVMKYFLLLKKEISCSRCPFFRMAATLIFSYSYKKDTLS